MKGEIVIKKIFIVINMVFLLFLFVNNSVVGQENEDIVIMRLIPSESLLDIGDDFNVTVYIETNISLGGWRIFELTFPNDKVTCNSVSEGLTWSGFFDSGDINQTSGNITDIQAWSMSFPNTSNIACNISFTAIKGGTVNINIVRVMISDETIENEANSTTVNATVKINTPDQPIHGGGSNGGGISGVLKDEDEDGIYDEFVNETGNSSEVEYDNETDTYLLDTDNDSEIDHVYDPETDELKEYPDTKNKDTDEEENDGLIDNQTLIIGVIIIFLIVLSVFVFVKFKK